MCEERRNKSSIFYLSHHGAYIYVTGFAKTGLITGIRNCSYSSFLSAKSIFVDFLLNSKIQNMTLLLYVHTIIILGELYKGQEEALNLPRSRQRTTMTRGVVRPAYLGALWAGNLYRCFTVGNCFLR